MDELYPADGAFKSLVVENGDVNPYMLTHQDLDFLASRAFTRDEILAIFSVSPSMLGMTTNFNRANMDAARYLHILLNVIPRLDDEMAMWNTQLVKKYDPTLELYYECPIPEDVGAKLKEARPARTYGARSTRRPRSTGSSRYLTSSVRSWSSRSTRRPSTA